MEKTKDITGDYLEILNRFIDKDELRVWLKKPFAIGDKIAASMGYSIAVVPFFGENYPDQSANVSKVYPMPHNMTRHIVTSELRDKMNNFPTVECFDELELACDACSGDGEVEFEFYHSGKNYEISSDCPVCDGQGTITKQSKTPNGKREIDHEKMFKIGNCVFYPDRIEELLFVAEKLEAKTIRLVNQTGQNNACLFVVNEVDVILMPSMCTCEVGGVITWD
jgi:hypothetical protein